MIDNFSLLNKLATDSSTCHFQQLLLHVCCAPCSCAIIERLLTEKVQPTLFFYNPNIYPRKEYDLRKDAVIILAKKHHLPMVDADYEDQAWMDRIKGLENEPERGRRCLACFDMRMERTALFASENNFPVFTTTTGISRHKDIDQVNQSGLKASLRYPGLSFLTRNWREKGALQRANEIIKAENLYRQSYCGCKFSLDEANARRSENTSSSLPSS